LILAAPAVVFRTLAPISSAATLSHPLPAIDQLGNRGTPPKCLSSRYSSASDIAC
jgi:hypothetical protein